MATARARAESPLVVIVGPTASGKTALAIKLARQFGGEIICADSRTIYKGMDIGTAKPSIDEQRGVPHWGLDLVTPGERFTAADFKQYAVRKIAEIRSRGSVPFIVGGTGLYVDGVVFDYSFGDSYDPLLRCSLEAMSLDQLQEYCYSNNITMPKDIHNRRHIVRAIEQKSINKKRRSHPIDNAVVVGIATDRDILRTKTKLRSEQMLAHGVVEEAIRLGKNYGWINEAMTGNVYPLVKSHLEGELSTDELNEKIATLDLRLAKRQMTWFRRNPYIYWGDSEHLADYVTSVLEHRI